MVGTADSALIREVSLTHSSLDRQALVYYGPSEPWSQLFADAS